MFITALTGIRGLGFITHPEVTADIHTGTIGVATVTGLLLTMRPPGGRHGVLA